MGRNKWNKSLTKAERKRVKDGITSFNHNRYSSHEYAAAEVPAAHRNQQFNTRGLAPQRQGQTSNNSWVHAVGFVILAAIVSVPRWESSEALGAASALRN